MLDVSVHDQVFQKLESARVNPLEVVEKKCQGVIFPREHCQEGPEDSMEPVFRFCNWNFRKWRLFTDNQLELGDDVRHELAVWPDRIQYGGSPTTKLGFAFAEDLTNKTLESLGQRRVWDFSLVLFEFPGNEDAAWLHDRFVKLIDHRGLADTRVP